MAEKKNTSGKEEGSERLKIEKVHISKIHPNEANPRVIKDAKFKKLQKSIQDFPEMLQIRPIVVDEGMMILGGNMRYQACKANGMKYVYIVKAENLTSDQKQEFIIKDNVGFGDWDWDVVANEWEAEKVEEWGLDVWVTDSSDDLLDVESDEETEPQPLSPKGTDDDYSVFELVMLYSNKQRLFTALNLSKSINNIDTNEAALMKIIEEYIKTTEK